MTRHQPAQTLPEGQPKQTTEVAAAAGENIVRHVHVDALSPHLVFSRGSFLRDDPRDELANRGHALNQFSIAALREDIDALMDLLDRGCVVTLHIGVHRDNSFSGDACRKHHARATVPVFRMPKRYSAAQLKEMRRILGREGGHARADSLSAARRRAIAVRAARIRWDQRRIQKKRTD